MHYHKRTIALVGSLFMLLFVSSCVRKKSEMAHSPMSGAAVHLVHVGTVTRDDLRSVTSVEVSHDGRYLYSTSFNPGTVNVFARNTATGQITHQDSLTNELFLRGSVAIRLSDDSKYAAVTSFRSQTVSLYERDPKTGKLNLLDFARHQEGGIIGLLWVIDAAFSPDSHFIYTIDPGGSGSVTVFRISDDKKLKWIESNLGEENCFDNARGIAMHPNGAALYVVSSDANTLVVLSRDKETGETSIEQVIKDEEGDIHGLEGAIWKNYLIANP